MMRISMADRRGVTLQKKVLAKLMLAEYYRPGFMDVLMKPESKAELKQLEEGKEVATYNVLKDWCNDEWVQKWAKEEPILSSVDNLTDYFHFTRESRRLYSSNAEILSTEAKRLLQELLGASESVRSKAVDSVKQLAPAEQVLLSNAMFDELQKEEKLDSKKFKTYLDAATAANLQKEAIARIKKLPVSRITAAHVGQMTSFIKTLDSATKEDLKTYLSANNKLTASINAAFK